MHDLVYSLFFLLLSLINVISHNVLEDFLVNCFLKVDGHQNFPQGRVCRKLHVRNMRAYMALYMDVLTCFMCVCVCACVYVPRSCAQNHTCAAVKITSIFGANDPSGYWAPQNCAPFKRFTLSLRTLSPQAIFGSVHLVIARSIKRAVKHMALCTCLSYDSIFFCFIWYLNIISFLTADLICITQSVCGSSVGTSLLLASSINISVVNQLNN